MSDDESVSCSSQSENEVVDDESSSGEEEVIMRVKKGKNTIIKENKKVKIHKEELAEDEKEEKVKVVKVEAPKPKRVLLHT